MSRFHRLQSQNQLHRPERTGVGDPNSLVLTDPLDGQYFQDTSTGSVYRYDAGTSNWELLVQYDRATGRIVNVNQATFTRTNRIGRLTSAITSSPVTSVNARLITAVQRGEDIKIVSSADETAIISLTVTTDTGSGDVTIPVQSTITDFDFPANSVIIVEDGLRNVYTSVDPNKIQSRIEIEHTASSIGSLLSDILIGDTGVTSISLIDIDPIVRLADGKKLIITDKRGNSQVVIVDGDQVLSGNQGSVTVQAFDPIWDYEVSRSFLYEPSYETTSRITQTESSILLQASQISDLSNSTASLNISVAENAANITLLSGVTDGINSSISTLEANASAQQATLTLLAGVTDGINSSISTLEANASAQQASLDLLAAVNDSQNSSIASINISVGENAANIVLLSNVTDGINSSISILEANASAQQATLALLASVNDTQNSSIAGITIDVSNLEASVNTSVQYDDSGAFIRLLAGPNGSNITIEADQINVDGVVTFINSGATTIDGGKITTGTITASQINVTDLFSESIEVGNVIKSNNYAVGSSGFAIFANGVAEFRDVTVDGAIVTDTGSSIDGTYVSNINAGSIVAGSIDANIISVSNINASNISVGVLSADRIGANTITAEKINVSDLFSESIEVGNVIKSNNYAAGSTGFAVFSNGDAEFRSVIVDGQIITGNNSSIDGLYVSNVNAGTITVGTLSADRIASNTITADKIVSNSITATQIAANTITADEINIADLYTTNATVNGVLTLDAGKLIAVDGGNSVTIDSNGITGISSVLGTTFNLPTDGSAPTFANGTVKEVTFEMYTSGVIRTSNNALTGDAGVLINNTGIFAGSAGQNTGNSNFRVSSTDGSLVAQSANIAGKLVAGAGSSIEGLYVSNLNASTITTGTINAALISVTNIDADNITTGTINASVISVTNLDADNIITGSIDANVITVSNINASEITAGIIDADRINTDALFAESVSVTNVISIGDSVNPMQIGEGLTYAGGLEAGDGIKLNDKNYWLYSTSEGDNVFRVGDDNNYVAWTSAGLEVRGTLNASDITSGTIDVARLNVDEILSENATVNGILTIGSLGEIDFDGGILDENGLTLAISSYASNGSAIKWGTDTAYIYTQTLGAVPFMTIENPTGAIRLVAGTQTLSIDNTTSKATISSDLEVTGTIQGAYKAANGSAGISGTRSWYDSAALETHNVTITNGIITSWTVTS